MSLLVSILVIAGDSDYFINASQQIFYQFTNIPLPIMTQQYIINRLQLIDGLYATYKFCNFFFHILQRLIISQGSTDPKILP